MLLGRIPSTLFPSDHVFVPDTLISLGLYAVINIVPDSVPLISNVSTPLRNETSSEYPMGACVSTTLYLPFGRLEKTIVPNSSVSLSKSPSAGT